MSKSVYRGPYLSFVPEYLRDKEDFHVFLKLLITEFDITLDNIENFTDLINPDKVPIKFIEALGSYFDYKYEVNADDDFNREILTRVSTIYSQRGTDRSILKAAIHGDNPGWVGGDIFIPGYPISKEYASLVVARDNIFTHSRSRHSGIDVFSDGETYRPGVIIINLPYLNPEIVDAVTEVMPAGVRFKFFVNTTFVGNDGDESLGQFGELSHYKCFRVVPLTEEEKKSDNSAANLALDINLMMKPDHFDKAMFSTKVPGRRLRSGRMVVMTDYEVESCLGSSMLNLGILKMGFLDENESEEKLAFYINNERIIPEDNKIFNRSTETGIFNSEYMIGGTVDEVNDIPKEIEKQDHPDATDTSINSDGSEVLEKDGRYIISPTKEKLDLWTKKGSHHLHRDIDTYGIEASMDLFTEVRLTAVRSHSSSIRSSHGKMSGILDHTVTAMTSYNVVTPYDVLYSISEVDNECWYVERDEHLLTPSRRDVYKHNEFDITTKPISYV